MARVLHRVQRALLQTLAQELAKVRIRIKFLSLTLFIGYSKACQPQNCSLCHPTNSSKCLKCASGFFRRPVKRGVLFNTDATTIETLSNQCVANCSLSLFTSITTNITSQVYDSSCRSNSAQLLFFPILKHRNFCWNNMPIRETPYCSCERIFSRSTRMLGCSHLPQLNNDE